MSRFVPSLLPLVATLSCYSAGGDGDETGGGAAAGTGAQSSGGSSTRGGSTSVGGGGSTSTAGNASGGLFGRGGSGGSGGSGGETCGPCPGVACQQAVLLTIAADPSVAPANLSMIQVEADGLTIDCQPASDCSVYCTSSEYQIVDGHYSLAVTAPGFVPATVDFEAIGPTNCGCCGCCPYSFYEQITLTPDGAALETCCADLDNDTMNCGACGTPCAVGELCSDGLCVAE